MATTVNEVYEKIIEDKVMKLVRSERFRQVAKWSEQKHNRVQWKAIFDEEMAEFWCKLVCDYHNEECVEELIQATAVLHAWAKHLIKDMMKEK
jgi:hypothetical protein